MVRPATWRGLYFYFLYLPKPIQYVLRGILLFQIRSYTGCFLVILSLVWASLSIFYGNADYRFVLADLYIDIGLIYWVFNSGRNQNSSVRSFSINFIALYIIFLCYMFYYGLDFTISDWRGDRLLSFFNGAAGIVLMSFGLNIMLIRKNVIWSVTFFLLLFASQSRMALVAPFITYTFGMILTRRPKIAKFLTFLLVIMVFSSFLWLPLTGINGTGRFVIWLNILQEQDLIYWYGDIFEVLESISDSEDQLHNLFLHIFLSRGIYIYLFLGLIVIRKLFSLIDLRLRYSYSTLLLFLLHSTTDNVVLYSFLVPFIL
jgi:hypothetical protein